MADTHNSNETNNLRNRVEARLLDAAEQLFAERGYDATSIRDITNHAKCNVAAVNYHFRNKQNLYTEVCRRRMAMMRDVRISSIDKVLSQTDHKPTLEELIRAFATAFIQPLIDQNTGRGFMKLMTREMLDPRLPKKVFVEELVQPTLNAMRSAIATVCPSLSQDKIIPSIISVIGQLVHVIHLNEIFDADDFVGDQTIRRAYAIDHIVEFSASAIRAMAQGESK